MGNVKRIIEEKALDVNNFMYNERFVVELCENVHVHYRDLRLEFDPEEFVKILNCFKQLDEEEIANFEYGDGKFKKLIECRLPDKTEFNDRYCVEEQDEGHFHTHYRNLRVEHKREIKLL